MKDTLPSITIDPNLCRRCGACVDECPADVFIGSGETSVPAVGMIGFCISCGHCVALCPAGAISHEAYPDGTVTGVDQGLLPSYEQMTALFTSRRSIRTFSTKPVEREAIERIIEAARFAPTAHNSQSTEYIVVTAPVVLAGITDLTVDYYERFIGHLANPLRRTMYRLMAGRVIDGALDNLPQMKAFVETSRKGTDRVLHGAPVLLLFHGDPIHPLVSENASLALQNATFAAEVLGLGSFYTGFVVIACARDTSIPRLLDLPLHHKILGGLALGYPRYRYKKWPERHRPRIKWL